MNSNENGISIPIKSESDASGIDKIIDKLNELDAIATKVNQKLVQIGQSAQSFGKLDKAVTSSTNKINSQMEKSIKAIDKYNKKASGGLKAPKSNDEGRFNEGTGAEQRSKIKGDGGASKLISSSKALKTASAMTKVLGGALQWSTRHLTGFARGLLRVAKYRAFRMVLNYLAQGLKNGVNSLYEFSSATSGAFSGAMNSIASNAKYASNALGSMVAPIIQMLAPAITYVTNLFVRATSAIAQFFSALGGSSTWSKPTKQAVKFGSATSNAVGGASKGAKKLKKDLQLLNFDQMNVLQDQSSNSGSGGSGGGGGLGALGGFETANVDSAISKLVNRLKTAWKKGDLSELYNIGLDIGGAINKGLDTLNTSILPKLRQKFENFSLNIGTTLGGIIRGMDWGKVAKSISLGVEVILDSVSAFVRTMDWGGIAEGFLEFFMGIDYKGLLASSTKLVASLAGAIYGVLVSATMSILNMGGKLLSKTFDAIAGFAKDGFFNGLKKAISSVGNWVKVNFIDPFVQAVRSALGIHSPSTVMKEIGKFTMEGFFAGLKNTWTTISSWVSGIANKIKSIFGGKKTSNTQTTTIKLKRDGWKTLSSWIGTNKTQYAQIGLKKKGWTSITKWLGIDNTLKVKVSVDKIANLKKKLGLDTTFKVSLKFPKIKVNWEEKTSGKTTVKVPSSFTTYYAKGGFPNVGEMFIAREAGAEMVGSLGGRTAVANNDQIEQGIASAVYPAVYNALMNAMNQGVFETNISLQGDANKLFKMVRDENRKNTMATGKNALAY